MFSLKDNIRRAITVTIASALATTVFVGCASTKDPEDTNIPIDSTTGITDELTPGITENPAVIAKNTLFHWVEEPIGADLAITASDFLEGAEQEIDDISSLYGLPVVVKESTRYLHSGNLMLELTEDGDLADEQDAKLVRYAHEPDTAGGAKIYIYKNDDTKYISQMSLTADKDLISRTDKFWSVLDGQVATNHDEYVISCAVEDYAVEIPENALVWYNGIATDIRVQAGLIPLEVLTADFTNILSYEKTGTGYGFTLYTGIGTVRINATLDNGDWVFNYTLPEGIDERDSVMLPAAEMSDASGNLCVSGKVLNEVFNYFIFSFSSVDMGDGSTEDIAVVITDNQDILKSDKTQREAAEKLLEEEQKKLDDMMLTTEEAEKQQEEREERQEMADNTQAYTTAGIPLTTDGGLTEPAKPTANYKLPANAQLTFSGDASTAERTTLPEGCYWTPYAYGSENAFTDPAGNVWLNNKYSKELMIAKGNMQCGYYDSRGWYQFSQEEIDYKAALDAADKKIVDEGPTGGEGSHLTDEQMEDLRNLRQ